MKYVITGAAGNVSKPLTEILLAAGQEVIVIGRNASNLAELQSKGAEIRIGSIEDRVFLAETFRGADAVFTMCPADMQEPSIRHFYERLAKTYEWAIRESGVKNVVNLSSIGANLESGAGPVSAMHQVETSLNRLQDVNVLHLRAAYFFNNYLNYIQMIEAMGIMGNNFSVAANEFPMVHTDDIAGVAASELLSLRFKGKGHRYVVGAETGTDEMARLIGNAIDMLGMPWIQFTDEQTRDGLMGAGASAGVADEIVELGGAINSGILFKEYRKEKPGKRGHVDAEDFSGMFARLWFATKTREKAAETYPAIVVGAGHAGLSASYHLKAAGIEHIVLEKGTIGHSWKTQRWDNFRLNTYDAAKLLPGESIENAGDNYFPTAKEFANDLEAYVRNNDLPVRQSAEVISVEKTEEEYSFKIIVLEKGRRKIYHCDQLIVCSGAQNRKPLHKIESLLPENITAIHASEYKNAAQLPPGAVLVVGSAQSGCQIAEEMALNGKKVFLATSNVPRVPGRYRGKDIVEWLTMARFFDQKEKDLKDPAMKLLPAPQLTGTTNPRETISLQGLAAKSVSILGSLIGVDDNHFLFEKNGREHVRFADEFSESVKQMIDDFIGKAGIETPLHIEEHADIADTHASCVNDAASISISENEISSVIFATGFSGSFDFLRLPVLDAEGNPIHAEGVSPVDGLYFLGLPWLINRGSGLIRGTANDSGVITEKVIKILRNKQPGSRSRVMENS
ncbi:MAG: NAD(P)-binding domain-containing protein [Gemmatimonadaceae bacterium]|nr:NAD(P)-binding domain-containing protein [Chitinophagaceae bacterium]